jgi:ketosteroid isomerase-like protein
MNLSNTFFKLIFFSIILFTGIISAHTHDEITKKEIRHQFDVFVEGYRLKDIEKVMQIFSPDVIANVNVQGTNERSYSDIRNGILRDFEEDDIDYLYTYAIKEFLCSSDLVMVRIIWTLQLKDKNSQKIIHTSTEVGVDIFKYIDKTWKLYRFIAFNVDSI